MLLFIQIGIQSTYKYKYLLVYLLEVLTKLLGYDRTDFCQVNIAQGHQLH